MTVYRDDRSGLNWLGCKKFKERASSSQLMLGIHLNFILNITNQKNIFTSHCYDKSGFSASSESSVRDTKMTQRMTPVQAH